MGTTPSLAVLAPALSHFHIAVDIRSNLDPMELGPEIGPLVLASDANEGYISCHCSFGKRCTHRDGRLKVKPSQLQMKRIAEERKRRHQLKAAERKNMRMAQEIDDELQYLAEQEEKRMDKLKKRKADDDMLIENTIERTIVIEVSGRRMSTQT